MVGMSPSDSCLCVNFTDIGHLVKVKGMVTRASDVKPQVAVCTYTCEVCGSEIFQDILGPQYMPMDKCISQRCTDNKTNGRLSMNTRGSRFVKYQELKLQELPDQVPVGHIPRSLTIHCKGEQTRQCGPGDIITVSGMFLTVSSILPFVFFHISFHHVTCFYLPYPCVIR